MSDSKRFKDLPDRNETDLSRATFEGLAVSKTKNNLHLAIESGVISIPFEAIESVTGLSAKDKHIVRIVVHKPEEVCHLIRVPTRSAIVRKPKGRGFLGRVTVDPADNTETTASHSGTPPEFDQTDDYLSW